VLAGSVALTIRSVASPDIEARWQLDTINRVALHDMLALSTLELQYTFPPVMSCAPMSLPQYLCFHCRSLSSDDVTPF
jgi:hypothetical protein